MNGRHLHFALRELQREGRNPRAWGIFALVVLVLGYSGPFQTFEVMSFGPRLAYWAIVSLLTYTAGSFGANYALSHLKDRKVALPLLIPVVGMGATIPVMLVVVTINILTFGIQGWTGTEITAIAFFTFMVSCLVTYVSHLFAVSHSDRSSPDQQPIRILERLPVHVRGALISMSVQDHYVEVKTSRGSELVLMRFRDAIAETDGYDGLQIHRSHWVALDAIAKVHRNAGKVAIELRDGTRLPVSRGFMDSVRSSGLL